MNIPAEPILISKLQPKKQLKQQITNQLKSNQLKANLKVIFNESLLQHEMAQH